MNCVILILSSLQPHWVVNILLRLGFGIYQFAVHSTYYDSTFDQNPPKEFTEIYGGFALGILLKKAYFP